MVEIESKKYIYYLVYVTLPLIQYTSQFTCCSCACATQGSIRGCAHWRGHICTGLWRDLATRKHKRRNEEEEEEEEETKRREREGRGGMAEKKGLLLVPTNYPPYFGITENITLAIQRDSHALGV